jgi:hypothetical protein
MVFFTIGGGGKTKPIKANLTDLKGIKHKSEASFQASTKILKERRKAKKNINLGKFFLTEV